MPLGDNVLPCGLTLRMFLAVNAPEKDVEVLFNMLAGEKTVITCAEAQDLRIAARFLWANNMLDKVGR